MKCPECKAKIKKSDAVCPNCGCDYHLPVKKDEATENAGTGVTMTPPEKLNVRLFSLLSVISAVIMIILIAVFVISGSRTSVNFTSSPKAVGDTLFFTDDRLIERLNTATNGVMATRANADGEPIRFGISGKTVWFITENKVKSSSFALNDEKDIVSGVEAATVFENTVYYVPTANKSQLRKCGLDGKNEGLVTVIFDDVDGVAGFYSCGGKIYILKDNGNLYCYDIKNESVEKLCDGSAISLDFTKREGVAVFIEGGGWGYYFLGASKERIESVPICTAATVYDGKVYTVKADNGEITVYENKKNGDVKRSTVICDYTDAEVLAFTCDGKNLWLVAEIDGTTEIIEINIGSFTPKAMA